MAGSVSLNELLICECTPPCSDFIASAGGRSRRQSGARVAARSSHRPRQGHREPLALVREKGAEVEGPKVRACRCNPSVHGAPLTVYDEDWDASTGVPFGAFAAQAIDWEIQDYLKRLRRQVPVQRSINLNDPADNRADDDEDEKSPEPERSDMMKVNVIETQFAAAKRRLVADRLGCLNLGEQRVIEGSLA